MKKRILMILTAVASLALPSRLPAIAPGSGTVFTGHVYHDSPTGLDLDYSLFVPKQNPSMAKYPLVVFLHDLSGVGKDAKAILSSNQGATVWALPEWQQEHPCMVLVPHFKRQTVDDDFHVTPDVDACLRLIEQIVRNNGVDKDRVYITGQSMGCMMSYVMMLRRPGFFASAMLVAGQWDASQLAPLAKEKLWLLSCQGDRKSSEGVAEAIKVWQGNGAVVREQLWPLDTTSQAYNDAVGRMLKQGGNIHYTHFIGGDHRATWQVAYGIPGIREWLFAQRRPERAADVYAALKSPSDSSLFVASWHGDFTGAMENSIGAIEKAYMKGSQMAVVDVCCKKGKLFLASMESLDDALRKTDGRIVLIVQPDSKRTALKLEEYAMKKNLHHQLLLYGSNYGTKLDYIACLNLDKDRNRLEEILEQNPLAVELQYTKAEGLAEAARRINRASKLCFRTNVGGYDRACQLGARIIITDELKPLAFRIQGLDKYTNVPVVVKTPVEAHWWHAVDSFDFSARHNVLIQNADGSELPMDEPYFESKLIAPGTWRILSDGDYAYLVEGDTMAVCIDTGYGAGNLRKYCETLTGKPVRYVVNTHYHFDHTAGNAYFDCAFMNKESVGRATIPYSSFKGVYIPRNYPVVVVGEGDKIDLGGRCLEIIGVPNHTDDGIALLDRSRRILFIGDELLSPGMGRLNVSVEKYAENMRKLVECIDDFDLIVGGVAYIEDTGCLKRHLACAEHILSGDTTSVIDPDAPKKEQYVKVVPKVPEGIEAVYVRHSPRAGDSAGNVPAPAAPMKMIQTTFAGVTLSYNPNNIHGNH